MSKIETKILSMNKFIMYDERLIIEYTFQNPCHFDINVFIPQAKTVIKPDISEFKEEFKNFMYSFHFSKEDILSIAHKIFIIVSEQFAQVSDLYS